MSVCDGMPTLTVKGIRVSFESGASVRDALSDWRGYVNVGMGDKLTTVAGRPALVRPRDRELGVTGMVQILVGTTRLYLHATSEDMPVERLIELIESMPLPATGQEATG